MKYFIEKVELHICFLFLVLIFFFPSFSFCDDVKNDERQSVGEALSAERHSNNVEGESEKLFDENTPIDISSSRNVDSAGNVSETPTLSDYNNGISDEFRIETASQELSYATHAFRLILSLSFVLVLAYVAICLMRRGRLFTVSDDPYIKLVANLNIEQGKTIKVVTIGQKAYVLGVAGSNITKLAELDDQVLIDAMKLRAEAEAEHDGTSFSKIFMNFFPTKQRKTGVVTGGSTEGKSFDDGFLRSQQERLKNINIQDDEI